MAFPNRCILTAPVARDLKAEFGRDVVPVPGATNGVLQAWDSIDQDFWTQLADPQITIYPTVKSIPVAIRRYLIQFIRYDDIAGTVNPTWKRWADCIATDFIRTQTGVKAVTALVGADRPTEWYLMHEWAGRVADTLGNPQ